MPSTGMIGCGAVECQAGPGRDLTCVLFNSVACHIRPRVQSAGARSDFVLCFCRVYTAVPALVPQHVCHGGRRSAEAAVSDDRT
jgi:hypothetical protein